MEHDRALSVVRYDDRPGWWVVRNVGGVCSERVFGPFATELEARLYAHGA